MVLETIVRRRRFFDPSKKKDMQVARYFVETHSWGIDGCPFILEYPYLAIPDMIRDKIIHKTMGLEFNRDHHMVGKR
jgi:hypothetical protein